MKDFCKRSKEHPYMSEEVVYAVAQNLAIEAEQATEEYQSLSKDAFARINAFRPK